MAAACSRFASVIIKRRLVSTSKSTAQRVRLALQQPLLAKAVCHMCTPETPRRLPVHDHRPHRSTVKVTAVLYRNCVASSQADARGCNVLSLLTCCCARTRAGGSSSDSGATGLARKPMGRIASLSLTPSARTPQCALLLLRPPLLTTRRLRTAAAWERSCDDKHAAFDAVRGHFLPDRPPGL